MIRLNAISWRFRKVWKRNLLTVRETWKINFITPLLEPLFYVFAFGLGFSGMIEVIRYGGAELSYVQFIAPALVGTAVMYNAFFETTYSSFVRMYYQKTYDGILATPLSMEEIIIAEIVWSATRATVAALLIMTVLGIFGFVSLPFAYLLTPVAFLGGLAFGALGLFITGIVPSIEMFNLPFFLFVTPMFLFSGTFFPISNLPGWVTPVARALPLHNLVELTRFFCIRHHETPLLFSLIYLFCFTIVFTLLALVTMRRRLIK